MPFPAAHSILTVLGDAYAGAEEWNTTLRLASTTPPTTEQLEAIDAAVETFLFSSQISFPGGRRYIGLKWAPQDVNGRYPEGQDAIEWLRPTPFAGNVSQPGYPQIALVLSLRTARTRGYASNGRMYWPSSIPTSPSTGRIGATEGTAVATAGAQMISAIAAAYADPIVASSVGAGRIELVTACRVGLVMDTQRRRRNQLSEEYVEAVPVP